MLEYRGFKIEEDKTVENVFYITKLDGSKFFAPENGCEMSITSINAKNESEVKNYIDTHLSKTDPPSVKLYGYIKVNSEGFGDGTEGDVSLLRDKEKLLESAWEDYKAELEYQEGSIEEDCEIYEDYEAFTNELLNGYVLIQCADFHIQYEWFEREV